MNKHKKELIDQLNGFEWHASSRGGISATARVIGDLDIFCLNVVATLGGSVSDPDPKAKTCKVRFHEWQVGYLKEQGLKTPAPVFSRQARFVPLTLNI